MADWDIDILWSRCLSLIVHLVVHLVLLSQVAREHHRVRHNHYFDPGQSSFGPHTLTVRQDGLASHSGCNSNITMTKNCARFLSGTWQRMNEIMLVMCSLWGTWSKECHKMLSLSPAVIASYFPYLRQLVNLKFVCL